MDIVFVCKMKNIFFIFLCLCLNNTVISTTYNNKQAYENKQNSIKLFINFLDSNLTKHQNDLNSCNELFQLNQDVTANNSTNENNTQSFIKFITENLAKQKSGRNYCNHLSQGDNSESSINNLSKKLKKIWITLSELQKTFSARIWVDVLLNHRSFNCIYNTLYFSIKECVNKNLIQYNNGDITLNDIITNVINKELDIVQDDPKLDWYIPIIEIQRTSIEEKCKQILDIKSQNDVEQGKRDIYECLQQFSDVSTMQNKDNIVRDISQKMLQHNQITENRCCLLF